MARFVMLLKYTEIGITRIQDTVKRADQFRADAKTLGVTIETIVWTLGEFDGVVLFEATDTETALALATHVGGRGYVRTCLLPAFTQDEFSRILTKLVAIP